MSAIKGWWEQYVSADNGASKAFVARMRRAGSVAQVLSLEPVQVLSQRLRLNNPYRLALIAQSVALVKTDSPRRLARALGAKQGEGRVLSEQRFRRLVTSRSDDDLRLAVRRVLPLVKHSCDVDALGQDLRYWTERKASDWCFDYYGTPRPGEQFGDLAQEASHP